MNQIKGVFDETFKQWDIHLPEADVQAEKPGSIHKNGWTISYRFDREGGQAFLEYFASHRMTNDTLNRIFTDGKREVVGYCQEFFPADDPGAEQGYHDHNRRFYEEVKARGLDQFEHGEAAPEQGH